MDNFARFVGGAVDAGVETAAVAGVTEDVEEVAAVDVDDVALLPSKQKRLSLDA